MQKIDAIVAVAGWEERFTEGLKRDLDLYAPSDLFLFRFEEYGSLTASHRNDISDFAGTKNVRVSEISVKREPAKLWETIKKTFTPNWWTGRSVLVDISTMPREVIWWVFSSLRHAGSRIRYVYYRPNQYASLWLTRDTEQPRLVYQHSGVAEFGLETCLLLISGFDVERAAQLVRFFEPKQIVIGLQSGDQFENKSRNIETTKKALDRITNIEFFDMNSYSQDHGLSEIQVAINPFLKKYNIVAASLGPKPSAVALYRLHLKNPEIALSYAPSRQFNPEYSKGIQDAIIGALNEEASL